MFLTISAIALFGLFLALLLRFRALGIGAAVIAVLFGFYLSRTGAADSIDQVMTALANAVRDIGN
ncbi:MULTISPECIES: hypothetical protein [Streptomyces]|uniref:DUF2304 family protein n=2 Tax=Streptomyces TaxID=1883 RepID=A0A3R7ERG8_9ACTN|nr:MULTISPECIES: hypothetical protein [Streptomyces]KNE79656.1 hypothetical protein ADZ36_26475 [Streptomyces fradiae]OFA37729.1 hypothetical protein BEN35_28660 [Streptomyces fradiae]PQM23197.1 hypothetical protein Sfr7A_11405 [Streptomyces xinghaiensis]RKM94757.1 hypothetical protein SFRA_015865 [Streptomyces xinghaiensis]RNC74801.1 hypothetical protein DC095_009085 [Streptomyces xinghaiensis]